MCTNLPNADDLDATWKFVEPGIEQILGGNSMTNLTRVEKVLSPTMYMEVYTAVYNYCVNKSRSAGHFQNDNSAMHQQEQVNRDSILVGGEIYGRLRSYLLNYISQLAQYDDETFLESYVRRWKRFTIGSIFLNHAFDYMNRYWVQKERSDGRRNIFDVNTLCLMTWKQVVFDKNSQKLTDEILQQLTLQRNGAIINQSDITTAIKSFVALGIDPSDLKKLNLNVYIQNFETNFILKTKEFYRTWSKQYLERNPVSDYIFEAHLRITDEECKIALYLDEHTKKPLSDILNEVLIREHSDELKSEFINLLQQRDEAKISTLYNLMQREFSLFPDLANTYEDYVKQVGEDEINILVGNIDEKDDLSKKMLNILPRDYIKKLIEVYKIFSKITLVCFQNNALFSRATDSACRYFINNNSFAMPLSSSRSTTSKTPEMLAKYSDQLLKRSKSPNDLETDLSVDDIMIIFKFLTDKDAFEYHYRKNFAKRLIHGTSTSEHDEEVVIQRLQNENSMEYTGKITKMLQDVRLSKQLETDFNNLMKNEQTSNGIKQIDFQPFVLAETMWPFPNQVVDFKIPNELMGTHTKLSNLYTKKHNGRILKWLWPLSRAEIIANIGKPGKPPFQFTVTLFQMSILLLFNDNDVLSLDEIQELTYLSYQNILASIVPFLKMKLILQISTDLDLENPSTQFKLNVPYKLVKSKVNFAAGVKSDGMMSLSSNTKHEMTEEQRMERELNSERQIFLEACIVRIMKAKRKLPHSILVNDCIEECHQRFNAKISLIKRAIDNLINKEYLQRCDDGELYEYLA